MVHFYCFCHAARNMRQNKPGSDVDDADAVLTHSLTHSHAPRLHVILMEMYRDIKTGLCFCIHIISTNNTPSACLL